MELMKIIFHCFNTDPGSDDDGDNDDGCMVPNIRRDLDEIPSTVPGSTENETISTLRSREKVK